MREGKTVKSGDKKVTKVKLKNLCRAITMQDGLALVCGRSPGHDLSPHDEARQHVDHVANRSWFS
jgi:hypothetical protein